jgi:hypothetical protein
MENEKETRIQPKVFILFVIVGLLPMAVGFLILLNGARDTYEDAVRGHLSVVAENAQMELSDHLRRIRDELNVVARTHDVRTAVQLSNNSVPTGDVTKVQSQWATAENDKPGVVASVVSSPVSQLLREYTLDSASFRDILVTDRHGRTVATTRKHAEYLLSGKRWWQYAFREGEGGRFLGDITFDENAGVFAMDVAIPILDRESGRAIGVVKAIVDSEQIINHVRSVKVGEQGHALLVRGDATVLVGPEATFKDGQRYKYIKDIRAAIENGDKAIVAGEGDQRVFLGLPQFKMKDSLPELDWYLTVEQPRSEALLLFGNINTKFVYILVFTVVLVGLLSVLFSWILAKPVIETDPHLERL